MSEATGARPAPARFKTWLGKVFARSAAGPNWPRGVLFLDLALIPTVLFMTIGHEEYLLSALFGLLFAMLSDPGGGIGSSTSRVAVFALAGAALTALAFGVGGEAWGWLVLVAFVVTLAAGLSVVFGVHRFVAATLLNVWFIVALAVAFSLSQHTLIDSHVWAQVLAWAGGSALWIAMAFAAWLVGGRRDRPQPVPELPGDTTRRALTPQIIAFATIRALAIAGASALAFGLDLSHAAWLPIATLIAMKPSLAQSTIVAAQRLCGAAIGAVVAALVLLIPTSQHGLRLLGSLHALEMVALVFLMHGAALRFWNYAVYTAAIAAGVLILMDLPQPSDYAAEGYRVLWTFCGVAIGVVVMLLAGLLAKHRGQASASRPTPPPSGRR